MKLRLLAFALFISISYPCLAQESEMNSIESAVGWRHFYFYGLSKTDPSSVELDAQALMGLFSATDAPPAIVSLALIDPKYVINQKGLTAWLFLYLKARVPDSDTLKYVASGKGFSFVSADEMRAVFGSHINWPKEVLGRHPYDFSPRRPFVLPFILPNSATPPRSLSQSLISPDGSFEIFGVAELDPQDPEKLLEIFSSLHPQSK